MNDILLRFLWTRSGRSLGLPLLATRPSAMALLCGLAAHCLFVLHVRRGAQVELAFIEVVALLTASEAVHGVILSRTRSGRSESPRRHLEGGVMKARDAVKQ